MIPGTQSTAIKNADGTWDILDVPIVHEGVIPRFSRDGKKVDEWDVTSDWFRQVIAVHARREQEGYMGRGFVDHHSPTERSQPDAGYIRPKRIGSIVIEGEQVAALMADIVSVPDEVYQSWIKTNRMPYRSIESLVAESGFIDGLALMPTRPPHFQLPMLTIGNEVVPPGTSAPTRQLVEAVACASAKQVDACIRRASMTKIAAEKKDVEEDRDESPIAKSADTTPPAEDSEPPASESGGDESTEEVAEAAVEETSDDAAMSAAWSDALETLKSVEVPAEEIPDFVAQLRSFADSLESTDPSTDDMGEQPIIDETGVDETPIGEQPMAAKRNAAAIVRAEAIATAARAEAREARKQIAIRDAVDEAMTRLSDYNLGSDPRKHLMAKAKEHGVHGLALYVETIVAHAPRSPGRSPEGEDLGVEALEDLPNEVMAYTNPREREAALIAFRRWRSQEQAGWDMSKRSLKATIHREVARIGAGS